MRPTQCVGELYLTAADLFALLPIINNNKKNFQAISNCRKQKKSLQIFREFSGVFQQNLIGPKSSAVLEPRTGQFSRAWGYEAKDLTIEAKEFKMCPRGQESPWKLLLCKLVQFVSSYK